MSVGFSAGELNYEELHVLAGVAPPDGAWIGLRVQANKWEWTAGTTQSKVDTKVSARVCNVPRVGDDILDR